MADFKISGTRLGALSAIYFAIYALMQIPSGVIADTLGTRTSIISGNLVAGLGSILFGMATGFEMACVGRFLVGLGVFISIMKNNSVWFHEKVFGIMSGLTLFLEILGGYGRWSFGPNFNCLPLAHSFHRDRRHFNFNCNGIPAFFLSFFELLRSFHMGWTTRSKAVIRTGVFWGGENFITKTHILGSVFVPDF